MKNVEYTMSMLNRLAETKRKRHIFGGILLSVSLLFGGLILTILTLTILTIKNEYYDEEMENEDEQQYN